MKVSQIALIGLASIAVFGFAARRATRTFDLKDPKGVNGLSFAVDSELEPIFGTSSGVSGQIVFDKDKPENSTGKIVVDTASVTLAAKGITDAMQQDWCLAPAKYPTIEFAVKKIAGVKKSKDGVYSGKITGNFSMHGVTKELTVDATATYLENKLQTRGGMPGKKGDLMVVRTNFTINRREFNVAPDLSSALIGDKIEIKLSAVAVSPNP